MHAFRLPDYSIHSNWRTNIALDEAVSCQPGGSLSTLLPAIFALLFLLRSSSAPSQHGRKSSGSREFWCHTCLRSRCNLPPNQPAVPYLQAAARARSRHSMPRYG
ncbi:hypothetical protein EJ03DRAFT_79570 [Teratosphaeria nubilosa]|uniref:Uncharacterized protein n=1 Tax=Teratosphaeria nubilosa TaxID=161662 RepID=A0A6G1LCE4_9PEZI|nr:hypothetical protein EJ03DRAFT_79570 [Teratosphaeria nubilosa]